MVGKQAVQCTFTALPTSAIFLVFGHLFDGNAGVARIALPVLASFAMDFPLSDRNPSSPAMGTHPIPADFHVLVSFLCAH